MKYLIVLSFCCISILSVSQNTFPSTGNTGIGTTSPSSKLTIDGIDNYSDGITIQNSASYRHLITGYTDGGSPTTGSALQFKVANNNAGGNTAVMTLKGSGYVGIGTTSPTSVLHISSGTERNTFRIYKNTTTANYLSVWQGTGGAALDPIGTGLLYLGYDQSTNVIIGNAGGNLGIGTTTPDYPLQIHSANVPTLAIGKGNQNTNGKSSLMFNAGDGTAANGFWVNYFKTASTDRLGFVDGGGIERMSILNGGNVGIGTTNPAFNLDVQGFGTRIKNTSTASNAYTTFRVQGPDYANGLEIDFFGNNNISSDPTFTYSGGAGSAAIINVNPRPLVLGTNNLPRILIDANGNVGMGTTSPDAKLAVSDASSDLSILKLKNSSWVCNQRTSIEFWNGANKNYPTSRIVSQMDGCGTDGEALSFETQTAGQTTLTSKLFIKNNGNVGIGTTSPDAKLAVAGQVHAQEVKVSITVPGPDYVFASDYKLPSLEEIKNYIDQNKHLPEVPSAKEMEKNGVQLGEMNMLLLKKIEELTLYTIEMNKKMEELKKELNDLKSK